MRRIGIADAMAGMRLALPVYNERGEILLRSNIPLSGTYLRRLEQKQCRVLWVHDSDTDDIQVADLLSERLRGQANLAVREALFAGEAALSELRASPPEKRLEYLQSTEFKKAVATNFPIAQVERVADQMTDELLSASPLARVFSALRLADTYLYIHSIDSTLIALMIARRLHLDRTLLRRLAVGCLLHDLGMALIDPAIAQRPDRLDADQLAELRQHPMLGYSLLMQVQEDRLASQIALQHHERQDGKGYPRGLVGTNRVVVDALDRWPGAMSLLAEITAVADVYDALTTDRPYRRAIVPEAIPQTLQSLASSQLNAQIVESLLEWIPLYPVGTEVVVTAGPVAGCRGVIAQFDQAEPRRPVIRLLYNRAGDRMRPVEVDLRKVRSVEIRSWASVKTT